MDQAAPDNPVLVMNASGHFFYANSAAFAAAGVTDDTPDPPGGVFGRTDGRLNGTIGEPPAMMVMLGPLPKSTPQDISAGVNQILTAAARRGVTSVRGPPRAASPESASTHCSTSSTAPPGSRCGCPRHSSR